jgi:hypothetical protein
MIKNIFVLFIFTSVLFAQDIKNFPALSQKDIPGGKIEREEIFDNSSLWGFIDGGADVYLEYGFDKLLFQEVKWKGESFRVEFYKMVDEESAFGMFSISTHKCEKQDTITKWICISPFQVQAAIGRFYISIANEKGSKKVEELTIALLKKILAKQKVKPFEIPISFAKKIDSINYNKVKFVKGDLGLQNGFPTWQEMFSSYKNYTIYVLQLDNEKLYTFFSKVNFNSVEDANKFIATLGIKIDNSQKYYSIKKEKLLKEIKIISEKEFYYSETNEGKPFLENF